MNESMNDGGVCRTAPATPGLLIIMKHNLKIKVVIGIKVLKQETDYLYKASM